MVLTRVFDAPRKLVFEAWSKPEHLMSWWGPNGFTVPTCEVDFRTGGALRLCMRGPDGKDYWMKATYREIVVPERIVFTADIGDANGQEILTTVTFAEAAGKTTLTVEQTVPLTGSMARGQRQGWGESLDRLANKLRTR